MIVFVSRVIILAALLYSALPALATPARAQQQDSGGAANGIVWREDAPKLQRQKEQSVPILVKEDRLSDNLRLTVSKARVIKVIDEQTLVLDNKMTVNLGGLYFVYNRNGRGPDAIAAYQMLQNEFLDKFVRVYQTRDEKRGRKNAFGHEIGHIERSDDDVWAQGSLIASGLARVYTTADNPEMTKELLNLERQARRLKTGFWAHDAWNIMKADDVESIVPERFQIVEGTITKIAQRQNNIYLNFGKDWRTDFTVQIPMEARKTFAREGQSPMDWTHQDIRVRGWVEDYNGPLIKIIHPSQIEFIGRDVAPVQYVMPHDF